MGHGAATAAAAAAGMPAGRGGIPPGAANAAYPFSPAPFPAGGLGVGMELGGFAHSIADMPPPPRYGAAASSVAGGAGRRRPPGHGQISSYAQEHSQQSSAPLTQASGGLNSHSQSMLSQESSYGVRLEPLSMQPFFFTCGRVVMMFRYIVLIVLFYSVRL